MACTGKGTQPYAALTTSLQKVEGKKLHSASNPLHHLPQIVGSVRDVQRVLQFVNASLFFQGNDDEEFVSAVTHRKGVIRDGTGWYMMLYKNGGCI